VKLPDKGDLIHLAWLEPRPLGTYSLAGAQMKVAATSISISGRVAHIRGDDPVDPTRLGVWLRIDDAYQASQPFEPKLCEKCGRLEVGPLDYSHVIKAPGSS